MDFSKLKHSFPTAFVERGRGYQAQGRVLSYDATADGSAVSSRVRGSASHVYECFIRVGPNDNVRGQCSCPVGFNCKHVVATLLEAAQDASIPDSTHAQAQVNGVSPATRNWLRRLDDSLGDAGPPVPYPLALYYLLSTSTAAGGRQLSVQLVKARTLGNGELGKTQPYSLSSGHGGARFTDDADSVALALLRGASQSFAPAELVVDGALGAQTLRAMLETGRARWREIGGLKLHLADARSGSLQWRAADEDGTLSVAADSSNSSCRLLPVSPPWYLDRQTGACGLFETGLSPGAASLMAAAPPLGLDEVSQVVRHLQTAAPDLPLPAAPSLEDRKVAPSPRLLLDSVNLNDYAPARWQAARAQPDWVEVAMLSFAYAGKQVAASDRKGALLLREGGAFVRIQRDREAEAEAWHTLQTLGMVIEVGVPGYEGTALTFDADDSVSWLDFVEHQLPALREQGWQIAFGENFRYELARADDWYGELESSSRGWFDLELGVEVDGKRINLLPLVAAAIQQASDNGRLEELLDADGEQGALAKLDDGRILRIPANRLQPIVGTLVELFNKEPLGLDGRLRFDNVQAGLLVDLDTADAGLSWRGGDALRAAAAKLRDFNGIQKIRPPQLLQGELREYQKTGLNWLQFLREYDLHGILADDMGLGKTIQVLAHLLVEKDAGRADLPSLVIAPTSLMLNWRREAQRFAPSLRVLTLHGPNRGKDFERIAQFDLVLTTYPLLPRDRDALLAMQYHLLVLDEAQFIKNPRTSAAQIACALDARHRLCLTGTPMENHLGELWSLFQFLMPGLLDSSQKFRKLFRTPIERHGDADRSAALRRRIGPFLLRREKSVVLHELPPKTEILREVVLEGAQRDLYETLRLAMHERVRHEISRRGLARSGIVVLDALLKLRQACCDPRLVKLEAARRAKQSAKMELLGDMLSSLLEDGRRILLFSQFTSMLKLIEDHVRKADIPYAKLTGSTRDRGTPIDRFQNGEVPLFLISLKAGGAGLNLTAADTVIHYDPWWNPAVERQATDRAHRIGQEKPVFVYKLIATGTVEQKIAEMQAEKQGLADAVLAGGDSAGSMLTPEIIEDLFAPL